jgi:hypothetical protein
MLDFLIKVDIGYNNKLIFVEVLIKTEEDINNG